MFFPHTTTTTARPPLPPLSALANAHIWANPGKAQRLRECLIAHPTLSPHFHLPHHHQQPQQTRRMTTQVGKAEGDWRRWMEGGGRAGGGVMTTRQLETHMLPHPIHPSPTFFISFMIVWRCGVQATCRVV